MSDTTKSSIVNFVALAVFAVVVLGFQAFIDSRYVPRAKLNEVVTEVRWNGTEIQYKKDGQWITANEARGENIYRAFGDTSKEEETKPTGMNKFEE